MAARDEKTGKFINQQTKSLKDIAANIKDENTANKTQQQLLIAGNKINELKLKSEDLTTQKLEATLEAVADRLSNPRTTEKQMATALENLDALVSESNELEASRAMAADTAAAGSVQSLVQLSDSIKSQNSILSNQLDMNKLGDQLDRLNTGTNRLYDNEEARMQIQEEFNLGQQALLSAIEEGDGQAIDIAMKQLGAVQDAASNEEARRESAKALEEQQSSLNRIGDSIAGLGGKFDSFADGVKGTGGFLAGLTGLALAIFSPETLQKFMNSAIEGVTNVINGIVKIFQGDTEEGLTLLGDNLGTVAAIIGGLALQFGGSIITKLGNLVKMVKTMMTAVKVFQAFMMTEFIPNMKSFFSGMMKRLGFTKILGIITAAATAFGTFMTATALPAIGAFFSGMIASISAALIPMLPVIAIGAGIALLLGGLYLAFSKLQDSLGPGAGIIDTLKVAALYFVDFLSMLVNAITFIPRKIIGFLGAKAAKWLFGDDVDTSMFDSISEGLDTDRGARAAEEIRLKNELEAEKKKKEAKPPEIVANGDYEDAMGSPSLALQPEIMASNDYQDIMGTSSENEAMMQEMGFGSETKAAPQLNQLNQGDTINKSTTVIKATRRGRRGYDLNTAVAW